MGLFFYLFTLGIGIYKKGPLPDGLVQHLINQFDGRFGQNQIFIFFLFNQYMRHVNIREVNAHLESNDKAVEQFNNWLKDKAFQERLKKALDKPESKESKRFIREVSPVLKVSSGAIPRYGPSRQRFVTTSLINYLRCFGYPSMFVTISPSDAESVLGLKMSISTAELKEGRSWNDIKAAERGPEDLNFQHDIRNKYIQNNPHFYAIAFQKMVELFFQCMVGLDLDVNIKKTVPLDSREEGIFGMVSAFYGVIESQARGSLHIHILIFGGALCPAALDRAAISDTLREKAAALIDSLIVAHVSGAAVREDIRRRRFRERADRPVLKNLIPKDSILKVLAGVTPEPQLIRDCQNITELSLCATNNHTHSLSCHAGFTGKFACRFGYPQMLVPKTRPVSLISEFDCIRENMTVEDVNNLEEMLAKDDEESEKKRQELLLKIAIQKRKAVAKVMIDEENQCKVLVPPKSLKEAMYWELERPELEVTETGRDGEDVRKELQKIASDVVELNANLQKLQQQVEENKIKGEDDEEDEDREREKAKMEKKAKEMEKSLFATEYGSTVKTYREYNMNIVEYNRCIATALQCN